MTSESPVKSLLPDGCRQKLAADGKPYPRSSCSVCGKFSPKWKECDAILASEPDIERLAALPGARGSVKKMSDKRKTIKITLPADCVQSFEQAKARAEQVAMIKLSDTQYASRLIQWALAQQEGGR